MMLLVGCSSETSEHREWSVADDGLLLFIMGTYFFDWMKTILIVY